MDIRNKMEKIGYNVSKLIIWAEKTKSILTAWGSWLSAPSPYIQTPAEGILISYKKQWKKNSKGTTTISKKDFIEGVSGFWNISSETKQLTKACFPVELPKRCIELLSYTNDIVLDPFMGSGSTAVACIQPNRNYIGYEISSNYCKIAQERINGLK